MRAATDRDHLPPYTLLFDGECAVCDRTVTWLLGRDPSGLLAYAPLAGPTAVSIRDRHPEWPTNLDSLVLVVQGEDAERILFHSTAVLTAVGMLPGAVPVLCRGLLWVPAFMRDPFYRGFARIRYRIFGKLDTCRLPQPSEAERFYV
ncbi:MAG: putative DCC family thiol-disulfide oxidoreductase YuxK [Myxococcota bacterium]|jgi:predicted DCC family thiol-disulfide oxidoreductase YuxK